MSEENTINDFYRGYLQGFKDSYHWVGLTDEEVIASSASSTYMDELDVWLFAKDIEAKLKEKNT